MDLTDVGYKAYTQKEYRTGMDCWKNYGRSSIFLKGKLKYGLGLVRANYITIFYTGQINANLLDDIAQEDVWR